MNTIIADKCPQCNREINNSTNRLVQDMCGHKKCRICLMQDDISCKLCQIEVAKSVNTNNILNVSVIKYDGHHKHEIDDLNNIKEINVNIQQNSNVNAQSINNTNDVEKKKIKRQYKALNMPSHVITVTKSPTLYKCTACSRSFSSTKNIKYHMYCNGLQKPLKCNECDKSFITQSSLEAHVRSHTGMRPFCCEICNKRFIQKSKLNRHMKLHTGDLQFVCTECGKKFSNKDGLAGHFRVHTGEKPFSCNQCDSQFRNKSNLNKHLATHSKDKLFMCEQCGKKFGKWALSVHKKIHSKKKSHSCDQCSKAFSNNQDLKRHLIIHGDAKMFCCSICSTKFRRKDILDRHIKNTHTANEIQQHKKTKSVINIDKSKPITKDEKLPETETLKLINDKNKNFQEKPNAINVIKSSIESNNIEKVQSLQNAVPVINGPFKLAFKTDTFKHNYNIHNRDYVEPTPHIKISKPYNMVQSLNICKRILSPMNVANDRPESSKNLLNIMPKNVIMSVGKVNEKDSLEICKKILSIEPTPPIHYETSFENKKHASIKNIKFKLPSTYTNSATKGTSETLTNNVTQDDEYCVSETNFAKEVNDINYEMECDTNEYTELQPVRLISNDNEFEVNEHQSVIVNPHMSYDVIHSEKDLNVPPFNEMHWRKRTSQISHAKKTNIL